MTARYTAAELAVIVARAKTASQGPWSVENFGELSPHGEVITSDVEIVMAADGESIVADHCTTRNAAFITACRTDVPRLVAELTRAREEIEQMKAAIKAWAECDVHDSRSDQIMDDLAAFAGVVLDEMGGAALGEEPS